MAYVGNSPEKGNFRKADQITCSATATYNLLVGGVAVNPNQNQCIVSLNGVIQSSGDSYTIASSQITFASALTSSDVIDFILILGDTLDVGTVSDDTIGLAQLSATGTPSSSNYLRGDNSWQTISGTTINTNADNRVITGSGTANTLNGEANLTFDSTDITVAGSGGIIFGSSGETLNSYEEGTWTPDMQTGGSNPSYTTQLGYYVKVGKTCTVTMNLNYTSTSSNIGLWGGLPFTCNANGGADSRGWIYHDKNTTMYCALIGSNGTTFYIRPQGTYSGGLMTPSDFSGKSMMMTITYPTA
jgi:hypothetical protein